MNSAEFLNWAIRHSGRRKEGYRKVKKQVIKRINQRINELDMDGYQLYKEYVEHNPEESDLLDRMMFITISRFFRDAWLWEELENNILPLNLSKTKEKESLFRFWSAGCASGEEPYSFAVLWKKKFQEMFPTMEPEIIATDSLGHMVARALRACYKKNSLKEVPRKWVNDVFVKKEKEYCLKQNYKDMVEFWVQDLRTGMPSGSFNLIFCKYVVAIYFAEYQAENIFKQIVDKLKPEGIIIVGSHEQIPLAKDRGLVMIRKGMYKKTIY